MIRDLSKAELEQTSGGLSLLTSTSMDFQFSENLDQEPMNTFEASDLASQYSVALLNNDTIGYLSESDRADEVSNMRRADIYREQPVSQGRIQRPHTFRSRFLKRK